MKTIISGAVSAALIMSLAMSQAQTTTGGNTTGAPAAAPGAAGETGGAGRAHLSSGAAAPAAKGAAAETPSARKLGGSNATGVAKDAQGLQSPPGSNAGGHDQRIGAGGEKQGAVPQSAAEQTGANAGGENHRSASTNVSADDRTKVRSEMVRANIRDAGNINVNVQIGATAPRTITEYWMSMPEEVVTIVPAWSGYRVVRIGNEILIIEPDTFRVVGVIED
jgi:hypothetical protein